MKQRGIPIKGFSMRDGKIVKVPGYKLSASAKIAQRKSKKVRVKK